jgi:hypothetical protein
MTVLFSGSGATNAVVFVPEPATVGLGFLGALGCLLLSRRR